MANRVAASQSSLTEKEVEAALKQNVIVVRSIEEANQMDSVLLRDVMMKMVYHKGHSKSWSWRREEECEG